MARNNRMSSGILRNEGLVLDLAAREVIVRGQTHHLTPMECRLLAIFLQHPGEVLTREFLMQEVWETDYAADTRTIEVHVFWLRQKIEEDPSNPDFILTVRGIGYVFES